MGFHVYVSCFFSCRLLYTLFGRSLWLTHAQCKKPHILYLSLSRSHPLKESQNKGKSPNSSVLYLGDYYNFFPWCSQPAKSLHLGTNPACGREIVTPHLQPIKFPCFTLGPWLLWQASLGPKNLCTVGVGECFAQYTCCYTFAIWLDLAYYIRGEALLSFLYTPSVLIIIQGGDFL